MGFWNRFTPLVMVAALAACDSVPTQADDAGEALFKKPSKPPDGGGGEDPTADPALAFHYDGGMWVMNEDGSNRVEVLRNDCSHSESSWAPTGDGTVADPYRVINWGTWASCLPMQIVEFDADGGTVHVQGVQAVEIAGSSDTNLFGDPAWSPAGAEIALGGDFLNPVTNEWEHAIYVIAVADLPNPTPQLVYAPVPGCGVDSPTWDRIGTAVVFREVCNGGNGGRILAADRGTGFVSEVVPFGVFDSMGTFEWARTSDVLAVTAMGPAKKGRGEEWNVYTIQLPGGSPESVAYGFGPTWSPDDSRLAFHYGLNRKLKTANATGGGEVTLGSGELPAWRR
jgi:hypothetical protein